MRASPDLAATVSRWADSRWVRLHEQPRKLVTRARISTVDNETGQFPAFLDAAGQLVLLVRRAELVALDRYEEPPF